MLKLSFGNLTVEMNIFRVFKQQDIESEIEEVDLIHTLADVYFKNGFTSESSVENQEVEE